MSGMKDFLAECEELADAWEGLANRTGAYGGYQSSGKPTTRKEEYAGSWRPLHEALTYHFAAEGSIGLHSTSPDNRCKWLAWDLDSHDGNGGDANMVAALEICKRLEAGKLRGVIFDSDGQGGLHVWCVLPEPMTAEDAYQLSHELIKPLPVRIEAYPKQPQIREGGYGNWLRVPGGKHPKTGYRSCVWMGNRWGTQEETVEALLTMSATRQESGGTGRRP